MPGSPPARFFPRRRPAGSTGPLTQSARGGAAWRIGDGRSDGPPFAEPRRIPSAPWTAALFPRRVVPPRGSSRRALRIVPGRRRFRHALRRAIARRGLRPRRGCLASWQRHSRPMASGNRPPHRPQQLFLLGRHYPAPILARWFWPIFVAQSLWGAVAVRHGAGIAWLRGAAQGVRRFSVMRRSCTQIDAKNADGSIALGRTDHSRGSGVHWL